MPREEIIVQLPKQDDSQSVEVIGFTKTKVTQANGIKIKDALVNKNNSLQITVEKTSSGNSTVIVKAGNNYPNKILGDKTIIIESELTTILLEDISRFENRDGSVELDFATGFTGNIWATAKRVGMKPVETTV